MLSRSQRRVLKAMCWVKCQGCICSSYDAQQEHVSPSIPSVRFPISFHTFLQTNKWLVVWNMFCFSIYLECPSSQLTKSYFSEGQAKNHQPDKYTHGGFGGSWDLSCQCGEFSSRMYGTFIAPGRRGFWKISVLVADWQDVGGLQLEII